ncbi:cytochrome c oxidase assembly factor 6 [Biomphalaria glabrata]|nr:cytochrome c oxidase assembly factor 6 [Biomphalaria glabrata]
MPFPKQDERQKCWDSKDRYWDCLTENNEDATKCLKQREDYEKSCIKQWVKYFDKRRDFLKYKEKVEKSGFEPQPESKQS